MPGRRSSAISRTASSASSSIPIDGKGTARSRAITPARQRRPGRRPSFREPPPLVDVGHAVLIGVPPFLLLDAFVPPVPQSQQDPGEQGGGQRAHQYTDLRVLVAKRARTEGELADQQGDGEPDSTEEGQA